jgi:hypothetical protein
MGVPVSLPGLWPSVKRRPLRHAEDHAVSYTESDVNLDAGLLKYVSMRFT